MIFLILYSKSMLPKGAVSIKKSRDDIISDYNLTDENGRYRELELRNTHREFGKHNRPNLYYPFFVSPDGEVSLEKENEDFCEVLPNWDDGYEGCWSWGQKKAREEGEFIAAKKIKGQWKIFRKAYAHINGETPTKQKKSIWTEKKYHTEKGQAKFNELFDSKNKIFPSPKSVSLISDCIEMAQLYNGICLDFFSGSATAAHATMQLNAEDGGNRKFIMVQLPEPTDENSEAYKAGYKNICEIGKERIRRAGRED